MGRTAEQKAVIEAWQRRLERDGFYATMEAFRNSTPGLKGRALPGAESDRADPGVSRTWSDAHSVFFHIARCQTF